MLQKRKNRKQTRFPSMPRVQTNIYISFLNLGKKSDEKEKERTIITPKGGQQEVATGAVRRETRKQQQSEKPRVKVEDRSATGYVNIILHRDKSGQPIRAEIYAVSREEALSNCKRVAEGKGCVFIKNYYSSSSIANPKTVVYWGPDTRERPCRKNLIFVGGSLVECMDKFLADKYKGEIATLIKMLAKQLSGKARATYYKFALQKIAEHFINLLDEERLKRSPDDPNINKILETIRNNALSTLREAARLLREVKPTIANEEQFENYKNKGLVSDTCPIFTVVRTITDDGKTVWCKKWLCMRPAGYNLELFVVEGDEWCVADKNDLSALKVPY